MLVEKAMKEALEAMLDRGVLGSDCSSFILHTDWAQGFGGYTLEVVRRIGRRALVDVGSKSLPHPTSSYLGELDALKWSLVSTREIRGDRPITLWCDNKGLVQVWETSPR